MIRFLTMRRLSILFVALFAIALIGLFGYQHFVVDPEKKCEANGQWWFADEKRCITPLYLPDITGRPEGVTRAQASDRSNRDLIALEEKLDAEKAARQAQTNRDRARVEGRE